MSSPNGCIFWDDFKKIFGCDETLSANLLKAHKLTLKALYPYNNRQNVGLALVIFHDTTISAAKFYLEKCTDALNFLQLINIWWTVVNSKHRYSVIKLGNAVVK